MRQISLHRALLAIAVLTSTAPEFAKGDDAGVVRISAGNRGSGVRISDQVVRGQSSATMRDSHLQQTALLGHCQDGHCACQCEADCDQCWEEWEECECCCEHQCCIIRCLLEMLHGVHCLRDKIAGHHGLCPLHTQRCQCGKIKCRRDRRSLATRMRDPHGHGFAGGGRSGRAGRNRDLDAVARAENAQFRRERFDQWLMRSRLNYFVPRGACGKGAPPIGCYTIVYPVDPWYGDARDGQVYAAQGQGGPVSVPLAPVIRHTYNYGWGVPSSRLTPISHLGGQPLYAYGNIPGGYSHEYVPPAGEPVPQPIPVQE